MVRRKNMILFISILFMAIGFASVSTVLYLNGQTYIASRQRDFDVYFSKAVEDGVENKFNIKTPLKAREIRSGTLTLTVIKSVFEETEINISCEITGKLKEKKQGMM